MCKNVAKQQKKTLFNGRLRLLEKKHFMSSSFICLPHRICNMSDFYLVVKCGITASRFTEYSEIYLSLKVTSGTPIVSAN